MISVDLLAYLLVNLYVPCVAPANTASKQTGTSIQP